MFSLEWRKAYLEFLRNITPQIILLGMTLVASSRIDINKFDISVEGFKRTALFLFFLALFFSAVLVNLMNFFEAAFDKCTPAQPGLESDLKQLQGLSKFWFSLKSAWASHKVRVVNMIVLMLIAEGTICCVFVLGVQAAVNNPLFNK
jgi:hypothetical protein